MTSPTKSLSSIHKRAGNYLPVNGGCETSLITFNGQVYSITFNRAPFAQEIVVRSFPDGTVIATWPWAGTFGCALVANGLVWIFGSQNEYTAGNAIISSTLDPVSWRPSTPIQVYTLPASLDYSLLNTGVCKSPTGYVLAVDLCLLSNNTQGRTIFLETTDLVNWTRFGLPFASGDTLFVGAFKPFYVPDGAHPNRCYMIYNSAVGGAPGLPQLPVYMNIAYTDDFTTFTSFNAAYLFPEYPDEGVNNSDGTLLQDGNVVLMNYFTGDQATWSALRTAAYFGTLAQFVAEFGF